MAAAADPSGPSLPRRLASVDKKVRDRALDLLTRWLLSRRSVEQPELSKIWKGLFYCYWHSDKPHVQSDLADRLASILLHLPSPLALSFFAEFMSTMRREWGGIDHLRIDKFYVLQRRFVRGMFKVLQQNSWDKQLVAEYMQALSTRNLMSPDSFHVLGSSMHVAEVFLEEMESAAPKDGEVFGMLLEPFYDVLAKSQDMVLVKRVKESVFDRMLAKGGEVVRDEIGEMVVRVPVEKRLFELGSGGETVQGNRKLLYSLYEDFKRLKRKVAAVVEKDKDDAVVSNLEAKFDVVAADSSLPPLEMVQSPLIVGRKKKVNKRKEASLLQGGSSSALPEYEGGRKQDGEQVKNPSEERPEQESGSSGKKKKMKPSEFPGEGPSEQEESTGDKKKMKQKTTAGTTLEQENDSGVKKMKRDKEVAAFGEGGKKKGGKQENPPGPGDKRLEQENGSGEKMVAEGSSDGVGQVSGGKQENGSSGKKIKQGTTVVGFSQEKTPAGSGELLSTPAVSKAAETPSSAGSSDKKKNRKNAFGIAVSPLNTASRKRKSSSNESPEFEGNTEGKKKVRFALKKNTMWKPMHPRSPAPPRKPTPSSSTTPKSSALKKGLLPGPIRKSPVNWKASPRRRTASTISATRKKASTTMSLNFNKWFSST